MGGPLAIKVISADLLHKSDAGGVALDVDGPEAAAGAYRGVIEAVRARAPEAVIDGVLVSPMIRGGTETILGVSNDPVFGPTVMFGLGGVFVESIRDVTFRLAPFAPEEAMRMIGEIRGRAVLEEPRGAPPRDLAALAATLSALSVYADEHRRDIQSIDVNPLLVLAEGEGVVAVNAVIQARPSPAAGPGSAREQEADDGQLSPPIVAARQESVLTLTLNRPERRNALDPAAWELLGGELRQASMDDSVRCVVLTGADRTFCAGADISAVRPGIRWSASGT